MENVLCCVYIMSGYIHIVPALSTFRLSKEELKEGTMCCLSLPFLLSHHFGESVWLEQENNMSEKTVGFLNC